MKKVDLSPREGEAYLTYDDPRAYIGLVKTKKATQQLPHICFKCQGYGGWILQHDAYGPGKHFKASCNDCNGWGHTARQYDHVHDWSNWKSIGRCYWQTTCVTCGAINTADSSD